MVRPVQPIARLCGLSSLLRKANGRTTRSHAPLPKTRDFGLDYWPGGAGCDLIRIRVERRIADGRSDHFRLGRRGRGVGRRGRLHGLGRFGLGWRRSAPGVAGAPGVCG